MIKSNFTRLTPPSSVDIPEGFSEHASEGKVQCSHLPSESTNLTRDSPFQHCPLLSTFECLTFMHGKLVIIKLCQPLHCSCNPFFISAMPLLLPPSTCQLWTGWGLSLKPLAISPAIITFLAVIGVLVHNHIFIYILFSTPFSFSAQDYTMLH